MALRCSFLHNLRTLRTARVAVLVIFACLVARTASETVTADECDWTGSGPSESGVTSVYLRCTEGRVTWKHPRGALLVLLRLPNPVSAAAQFRACVRPLKGSGGTTIWLQKRASLKKMFPEVRVKRGVAPPLECALSENGQVALFVETEAGAPDTDLSFQYHLEQLPSSGRFDPEKECKPCSEEELATAFCTSDLVARGRIVKTAENFVLKQTTLSVRATKTLRTLQGDDELENSIQAPVDDKTFHVVVGQHCDARQGDGEFVFMARRKLGDLTLTCAPRLEDWVRLSRRLNRVGASECILTA
ncbi:meteorin-like protein [Neocloeon triangulifer]|uniref:meteorin-like protein n=1 Tax=Neocloeon triangulifer TaxID=2078957 RepID=UPI00286F8AA9|nr:meteorin-like protein [Neocloeon triangulifer]